MMTTTVKAISGISLLACLLAGCASPLPQPDVERQVFSWVEPGRTTRSDAIFALGMPRSVFQQDTIFVYGVNCPSRIKCQTAPWRGLGGGDLHYQLVLTFDAAGLLEQRVLLREFYLPGTMTPGPYSEP